MFRLKDYNTNDTIAAIATFPSTSALGIIRISGKKSLNIISSVFQSAKNKNIKKVKTHTLHYGWIVDRAQSAKRIAYGGKHQTPHVIIDEVLVSIMRAPLSYTKENTVEISCHGGLFVLNKILEIILNQDARLALPGEFTYRAFINGRIDLLQAEGILSIIEAKSEDSLALAIKQLNGYFSKKISGIKDDLKETFIETEALINFPEDEIAVNLSKIKGKIKSIKKEVNNLLAGSEEAKLLKEGLKCVICGKTNVGKSTLFNRLLKEERVIVSRFPGTTRDVIEETINIRGVPLRIYDTAGILEPKDLIDKKAIEKSALIFSEADLIILVMDGSRLLNKDDLFLIKKIESLHASGQNKNVIIAINKSDLKQRLELKNIAKIKGYKVKLSALRNKGIKELERAVYDIVYKQGIKKDDMVFLSQYQRQVFKKVRDSVLEAEQFLEKGYSVDFANLSLKQAVENLTRLSGEVLSEEVLESIFSNFCIGK